MDGPRPDDDPRWFTPRTLLFALVPMLGVRHGAGGSSAHLALLRQVFLAFAMSLVLIGFVAAMLASGDPEPGETNVGLISAAVAAFGVLTLLATRLIERPLDCSSAAALAASYRTRFFLRTAFANSAALVGFVGTFLAGSALPYVPGALLAAVGYARMAPTRRNLQREGEALALRGCERSLVAALTAAAATDRS